MTKIKGVKNWYCSLEMKEFWFHQLGNPILVPAQHEHVPRPRALKGVGILSLFPFTIYHHNDAQGNTWQSNTVRGNWIGTSRQRSPKQMACSTNILDTHTSQRWHCLAIPDRF